MLIEVLIILLSATVSFAETESFPVTFIVPPVTVAAVVFSILLTETLAPTAAPVPAAMESAPA